MIPDEIYLPFDFDDAVQTDFSKRLFKSDIKYIRAPVAKRFSDDKPKDGELIGWRGIGELHWDIVNWNDIHTLSDFNKAEWFPIILPTEEK